MVFKGAILGVVATWAVDGMGYWKFIGLWVICTARLLILLNTYRLPNNFTATSHWVLAVVDYIFKGCKK